MNDTTNRPNTEPPIDAAGLLTGITPGDWTREGASVVVRSSSGGYENLIAHGHAENEIPEDQFFKNLTLIAAAPALARRVVELEAALRLFVEWERSSLEGGKLKDPRLLVTAMVACHRVLAGGAA